MNLPLPPQSKELTPDALVMLDRIEGFAVEPLVPRTTLAAPRPTIWIWLVATLCYVIVAILPVFEHAKTSSALGPCVLIVALGLVLLVRRPFLWRAAAMGVALVIAGSWIGWILINAAHFVWHHLSNTEQASVLQETLRRARWAAGSSAGLGLWCKTSHVMAWIGALLGLACSLAMIMS